MKPIAAFTFAIGLHILFQARSTAAEGPLKFGLVKLEPSLIPLFEEKASFICTEPTGRPDFTIRIENGIQLNDTGLVSRITDFSFTGSPAGLANKLEETGLPIMRDRIYAAGNPPDTRTKVKVEDFSGTLLELLVTCIPEQYSESAWVATVRRDGSISLRFGEPIKSTPLLKSEEILPPSLPAKPPSRRPPRR